MSTDNLRRLIVLTPIADADLNNLSDRLFISRSEAVRKSLRLAAENFQLAESGDGELLLCLSTRVANDENKAGEKQGVTLVDSLKRWAANEGIQVRITPLREGDK